MNRFEQKQQFKIETIKTPEGNEVSFCPERGGIITSLKFKGKEVLYMDEQTLNNKDVNIKGGVPILFPNAGPIPDELKGREFDSLKQHGFAREVQWQHKVYSNGFEESLSSSSETNKLFPYNFNLKIFGRFEQDGSFTIEQSVENLEESKDMPISSGLHPYSKVPSNEKQNIKFDFKGGAFISENVEKWSDGKFISLENPGVPMEVNVPETGVLVFKQSKGYKRIWVWSLKDKGFFCFEPVMRDPGGIISDPKKISPGEQQTFSFNVKLEES